MSPLAGLFELLAPRVAASTLHGVRLLPAALLCPFLGGPLVPAVVRLSLALGLGACAWSATGSALFTGSGPDLLLAAARELSLGMALGFLAAIPFEAARAGGRLIDTLRGATLSELHVAPMRQRESASGDLMVQWLLVLAANAGGNRLVVSTLLETFHAIPAGQGVAPGALLSVSLRGATELLACAFALGAPAAAGVLAADLSVCLALRSSRLFVAAAAQPTRAALGILAVALPAAAIGGRLTSAVALSTGLLRVAGTGMPP